MGIVGDVHDTALDVPAEQFVYMPMLDSVSEGVRAMTLTVRSDTDMLALVPVLRGVVEGMDPDLPLAEVRSMDLVLGASVSRTSFTMALLLLAAGIALFLGADAPTVHRLILIQGMRLALTGILLGLGGALAMGRVISSLLFDVSPYDAWAFVGGSVMFLTAAAVASLVPSARTAAIPQLSP